MSYIIKFRRIMDRLTSIPFSLWIGKVWIHIAGQRCFCRHCLGLFVYGGLIKVAVSFGGWKIGGVETRVALEEAKVPLCQSPLLSVAS
jgi:hypothetical protein